MIELWVVGAVMASSCLTPLEGGLKGRARRKAGGLQVECVG